MVEKFERFAQSFEDQSPGVAARIRNLAQELSDEGEISINIDKVFEYEDGKRVYHHPKFDYYPDGNYLNINGNKVTLFPSLNELLYVLALNVNRFMKAVELTKKVFGENYFDPTGTNVRVNISRLKKVLQKNGLEDNSVIINRLRLGYSLIDPNRRPEDSVYYHPAFIYYPQRNLVNASGQEIYLTDRENLFLAVLAREPNRVAPYSEIADNIWGNYKVRGDQNASIRVIAMRLRKKIKPVLSKNGFDPQIIVTVPDEGYFLRDLEKKYLD